MPYQHFKMEGLHCLRNILKKGDYMCKLDLKNAYFFSSIKSCIQKICAVSLEKLRVSFLPLLWTRPSIKNFYKIIQNYSISVLPHLNILIIIYLDDMLLIDYTIEETLEIQKPSFFNNQDLY